MKNKIIKASLIIITLFISSLYSQAIIIDHNCTDLSGVPQSWINEAKNRFRIYYEHTSHGSQIVTGMEVIQNHLGLPYTFNHSGSGGALSLHDVWNGDLGQSGDLTWESTTRTLLNQPGNDRNIIMWSWCGGVSDNTETGINTYLDAMDKLEKDYPDVTFIYMTGHLDGTGETGNLNIRNNQIRNYCTANNKVLFDFTDIESYDPDGNFFLDRYANDECYYDSGNWAEEWCTANPGSELCYTCECAHSQPLNCNLKARAFWWMMARLAGWDGSTEEPGSSYSIHPTSISFGQVHVDSSRSDTLTITNKGTVQVKIDSLATSNDVFTLSTLPAKSNLHIPGFSLGAGQSRKIKITFIPESAQTYSASLTIYSSQTGNKTAALNGEGFEIPAGGFHVKGNVSGTWSSYDTVFVDGEITVPNGETLTITPVNQGTTILFTGHYKFNVYGRLLVQGTKNDTVYFTALDTTKGWHGLRFHDLNYNGMDSSLISYASIKYGRVSGSTWNDSRGGAVFLSESSPVIKNTLIKNNSTSGQGGGLFCSYGSSPVVSNIKFSNNTAQGEGGAIYCMDDISPYFSNITVTGNKASSGGGISCGSHNAVFKNITVTHNRANEEWANGGGILCNADFSLTKAYISNNTSNCHGGGIACTYQNSPVLNNVTIDSNSANESGGGMSCFYSSNPKLSNVTINSNTAGSEGGGISCQYDSNPVINDATIKNNSAGSEGGGLCCNLSSPVLKNVKLFGNTATSRGGGIAVMDSSDAVFQNCLIYDNTAEWGGGIIFLYSEGKSSLTNLTIVQNKALISGGGIAFDWGNPIIKNTILWNNQATDQGNQIYLHVENADPCFYYCDIEGGLTNFGGSGSGTSYDNTRYQNNIQTYPLFADTSNNNFNLTQGSDCIDSGDPDTTGLNLPLLDLNGNPRITGGTIDIGCFEWQGIVNACDDNFQKPESFTVFPNFPNPFNPETTIRFTIPKSQPVKISIFDLMGHEITTVLNQIKSAGEHRITVNGSTLASGIYLYQVLTPEFHHIGKMTVVK